MSLQRLSIQGFRNIEQLDIELSKGANLFYGANGSGKTSILESIALLSLGRSFRTRKTRSLISHGAESFTVFGQLVDTGGTPVAVGISKDIAGGVLIKKSGQQCESVAELAEIFPLRLLDGHSFQLLEGSPLVRRQFLDWLVFHMEPEFLQVWRKFERCLKQRNNLIRHAKIDRLLLDSWELELVRSGNLLHSMRTQVFEYFQQVFDQLTRDELPELLIDKIVVCYHPGWNTELALDELFNEQRQRDSALGYTLQGPHRADFQVSLGKHKALEVLSRGQQKLVITALFVAQSIVLYHLKNVKTAFLVDDLPAELDSDMRQKVARWLTNLDTQLFLTGVDYQTLLSLWPDADLGLQEKSMFHVEHGRAIRCDL